MSRSDCVEQVDLTISGNLRIMLNEMTVLIGRLDVDGEVALIADGRAQYREKPVRDDEWKTARLNRFLAVGYAGQVGYGNQVLARLFGVNCTMRDPQEVRLVRLLEERGIEKLNLTWAASVEAITGLIEKLASELDAHRERGFQIDPLELTFLLAGVSEGVSRLALWHRNYGWRPITVGPKQPGKIGATVAAGPEGKSIDAHPILENTEIPLEDRAKRSIVYYATAFPGKVNEYMTLRRSSREFRLEVSP